MRLNLITGHQFNFGNRLDVVGATSPTEVAAFDYQTATTLRLRAKFRESNGQFECSVPRCRFRHRVHRTEVKGFAKLAAGDVILLNQPSHQA